MQICCTENGSKPVPAIGSHMVIASGRSTKHIYTAAKKLAGLLNAHGLKVLGTSISVEGDRDDDWLVVDGGAFIFSLFLPDARVEYDLEGLWAPGGGSGGESSGMWHIDDIDKDDDDDDGDDADDDDGAIVRLFAAPFACRWFFLDCLSLRLRMQVRCVPRCASNDGMFCCPGLHREKIGRMRTIFCSTNPNESDVEVP